MSYELLNDLPEYLKIFVVFDCRNIHEDIIHQLTKAWCQEVDGEMSVKARVEIRENGGSDVGVIYMFNTNDGGEDYVNLTIGEWISYYWYSFTNRTLESIISAEYHNMSWTYDGGVHWADNDSEDLKDQRFDRLQELIAVTSTLLYVGEKYNDAIELTKVSHETRKIYTIRVNPAYLYGTPSIKPPRPLVESTFRNELTLLRQEHTNQRIDVSAGYVYGLSNLVFPGWLKIGSCVDLVERLAQYQTSDPLRRYVYKFSVFVDSRSKIEELMHNHPDLAPCRSGNTEWFKTTPEIAKAVIENLVR
jgi:hypothetical protein